MTFFHLYFNYKLFSTIYKPYTMLEAEASSPSLQEASTTKLLPFFPFLDIFVFKELGIDIYKGKKSPSNSALSIRGFIRKVQLINNLA